MVHINNINQDKASVSIRINYFHRVMSHIRYDKCTFVSLNCQNGGCLATLPPRDGLSRRPPLVPFEFSLGTAQCLMELYGSRHLGPFAYNKSKRTRIEFVGN